MDYYGLIGNPVSHSLSEKYFTDKFTINNTDARFERFLLKDIDALPHLLSVYPLLRGLSVTSPFKTDVLKYCNALDETAKKIGAVNTLKISKKNGKLFLKGYNTDMDGFATAILSFIGNKRPDALILGSGGAARAVAFALAGLGIQFKVVSRNPGKGKISYTDLTKSNIISHPLIINATPLGMGRFIDQAPDIPYQYLNKKNILFDLIYNPQESSFLQKGKKQGARIENGFTMLQAQAEKAWSIWQGQMD
jgi:shikimate dehydrogenase